MLLGAALYWETPLLHGRETRDVTVVNIDSARGHVASEVIGTG